MTGREDEGPQSRLALRVLLLTTRDIGQRATGRIAVLRTHAQALAALGHEVTVVVVSPAPPGDTLWSRLFPTEHVPAPGIFNVGLSALHALTLGRRSLNESLFVNRSVRRRVLRLAEERGADVIVVDSLRLFSAVDGVTVPVVVDLDDLLSVRYQRLRTTARHDPEALLGFAATRIPKALVGVLARAAVLLLGWESRRIAARELTVAGYAAAVSLVSRSEVEELTRRARRNVWWLPPAVPIPEDPVNQHDGLVFLGGLDYLPNLQAVRLYRDDVLPHLDPDDARHVLHVVGHCPEAARQELDMPGIVLHGYVDDLHSALGRRLMVAPLPAGGGIKLKVLDGMAHGLAVAGTPGAFEGLGLPPGVVFEAEDGAALADLIQRLAAETARCEEAGLRARDVVRTTFDLDAAAHRWATVLGELPVPAS